MFLAGFAILLVAWFIWASRPLSTLEVREFARRRRVVTIEKHLGFSEDQADVDLDFKRLMRTQGHLYDMNESLSSFPSIAAALLKWKKHEWVIFAYARRGRVLGMWLNKGPNKETVWPLLGLEKLAEVARRQGADTVLDFHNHPNPNPRRFQTCHPSCQDQTHADFFGARFVSLRMTYLAFVNERGRHYQYACWVPNDCFPLDIFESEIVATNGTSRFANMRLRMKHRAYSRLMSLLQFENASDNLGVVRRKSSSMSSCPAPIPRFPTSPAPPNPAERSLPMPIAPVDMIPVQSSYIMAVGYDVSQQLLRVAFRNGSVYQYCGVPESECRQLLEAQSKGSFLKARIVNGGYRYSQIT